MNLNCDLSRKNALSKEYPYYCAFNRNGECINPYVDMKVQSQTYDLVGLIVPACTDVTPIPSTTEVPNKILMTDYFAAAKAKKVDWSTTIVMKYEFASDGRNEDGIAIIQSKSPDPKDILAAIKDDGFSWEIEDEDSEIFVINSRFSGKELLKLAHMKLNWKYELVDADTPEEPEKPLELPNISLSFCTRPEEEKEE